MLSPKPLTISPINIVLLTVTIFSFPAGGGIADTLLSTQENIETPSELVVSQSQSKPGAIAPLPPLIAFSNTLSAKNPTHPHSEPESEQMLLDRISAQKNSSWIQNGYLTEDTNYLRQYVSALADQGLDSNAYFSHELQESKLHTLPSQELDALLNKVLRKVLNDLGSGLVDPRENQQNWFRAANVTDTDSLLELVSTGVISVRNAIKSATTKPARFGGQTKMLSKLKAIEEKGQFFVAKGESLELGIRSDRVRSLKKALMRLGDYRVANEQTFDPDDLFDSQLTSAVLSFQERHGLLADGIAGPRTLRALNRPIATKIAQVEANLERLRWMPPSLGNLNILINIPDYKLTVENENKKLFDMAVVVGKPEHMTPVFSETMKYIVFAPTWTVPHSITIDELIPKELESPGHLENQDIEFFRYTKDGLKRVPRQNITPDILRTRPFPYVLRQAASDKNVLGKVKFLMPNEHSVYLHDTQAKSLFRNTRRAYSHGCVRLAKPDLMASMLLRMDGRTEQRLQAYQASEVTKTVSLKTPIPTHMVYFTAWEDHEGTLHFREDIYNQDEPLINALVEKIRSDVEAATKPDTKISMADEDLSPSF